MATTVTINVGPNGATQYPGSNGAWEKDVTVTFTGNYAQNGTSSTVTAAQLGFTRILSVNAVQPMALATDSLSGNEIGWTIPSGGASVIFWLYENAAAGSPSAVKTDAEAYITGQSVRCNISGY